MEAEKFGELISHHFPHWAIINEDKEVDVLTNEFYYWKAENDDQRDIVFLLGDAQSIDPQGHYVVVHSILNILRRFNVEDVVTLGGFGTGVMVEDPNVYGVVTDKENIPDYEDMGVSFDHSVGQIIGASGLLLGIGERYGMQGVCLLGETPGFLLSDPKATEEVLRVLEQILNVDVDYSQLDEKVEEAEQVIKKIRDLQKQAQQQQDQEGQAGEELGYIG